MKSNELKEYVKTEESKKQVARSNECFLAASPLLKDRIFAVIVPTETTFRDVGSCVLLKIGKRIFVATAAHVIDEIKKAGVSFVAVQGVNSFTMIDCNGCWRADDEKIDGERLIIDAAIFELVGDVSKHLIQNAFDERETCRPIPSKWHMVTGYPYASAERTPNSVSIVPLFVSATLNGPRYIENKIVNFLFGDMSITQVSYGFVYYGYKIENDRIDKMHSLKNMSGGPVFCMPKVSDDPEHLTIDPTDIKLSAIFVETMKRTLDNPPLIIATSIDVHFALARCLMSNDAAYEYQWPVMGNMF